MIFLPQYISEDLYFVFMKTHWINVNIGKDPKADIHFYYDQVTINITL